MKHLKASEIRQKFIDFFKEHDHMVEPSAPLMQSMMIHCYGLTLVSQR